MNYMARNRKKTPKAGRFGAITTTISTTLVLILLGMVVLFVGIGNNFSQQLREGLTVEVMLHDSIANADLLAVQTRLR